MDNEIWKPLPPPYESYFVSNLGRVKRKEKILKYSLGGRPRKQYLCARIFHKEKAFKTGVHRLVYLAFYGEIPEGCHIDHIDEDHRNNRLENLRALGVYENVTRYREELEDLIEKPF